MQDTVCGLVPDDCHLIPRHPVSIGSAGAAVPAAAFRVSARLLFSLTGVVLAMASAPYPKACAEQTERSRPSTAPKSGTASAGPKPFSPGVRIDWGRRHVEVDAEVVLRKGPLELLACSPRTREHESILVVHARPRDIYQAMGLIGLEPGSPARFDEANNRWLPPTGDRLELFIRYEDNGVARAVPARVWLQDAKSGRPPSNLEWVFSGSRTFEDGRFGADGDGTVACVVDFDTALITVGALHTADNESLWLVADTEAIPPIGTRCTLQIAPMERGLMTVEVDKSGILRHNGAAVTPSEVSRLFEIEEAKAKSFSRVILFLDAGVLEQTREAVVGSLVRAGVDRAKITVVNKDGRGSRPEPATESKGG